MIYVKCIYFFHRQLYRYFINSSCKLCFGRWTCVIFKSYKLPKELIDENDKAATNMLISETYQAIPSLIIPSPRSYRGDIASISLDQPGG